MTTPSHDQNGSGPTAPDGHLDGAAVERSVNRFIAFIVVLAIGFVGLVVHLELNNPATRVDWPVFAVIAALLLITESRATTWLRFGDGGVVTPSWAFSFALMLLGSPTAAIAAMAATTVIADLIARKDLRKIVFNAAQISLSLALGGLVLLGFGINQPFFDDVSMPFSWGVAMILSGTIVFVTNGVIICYLLAMLERKSFVTMLRDEFVLTISADAAMLALAPILVISLRYSMLMLPLIGTATFLVFQTARLALQRAHEANHDPLTLVLNRRAFNHELTDFVEDGISPGAIAILDLDRFKEINDRLGHQTGDAVLFSFAERIVASLPSTARVARLGGDEFAVLLRNIAPDEACETVRELHEALDEPLVVRGFPISTGSSIGVAMYPDHGTTPGELLHAADIAMYRAKRYRSCLEVYEPFGTTIERGRVGLLADLSNAIEQQEFAIEYQPQIDIASGRICAVEALIRWDHPTSGRIRPSDFVALAEQTDLIGPLTSLVIDLALDDIGDCGITIAVNVSSRNLEDRHFASRTIDALISRGIRPEMLELEITESAIAQEPERTMIAIESLRSAGVRISIDDFGTGYSSFATLRDLTVDRIKIDRSFVSQVTTDERLRQIVDSIVGIAHALGLDVVAEGVEDQPTLDLVDAAGCDVAQGYLFSRPLPIDRLRALLAAGLDAGDLVVAPATMP